MALKEAFHFKKQPPSSAKFRCARYLSLSLSSTLRHVIPWNCIPASALLRPFFFFFFFFFYRGAILITSDILFLLATQHDWESAEIGKQHARGTRDNRKRRAWMSSFDFTCSSLEWSDARNSLSLNSSFFCS